MPGGTLSKSFYRLRDLLRRFSSGDFTKGGVAYIKQALLDRTLVILKNPAFIADMTVQFTWHITPLSPGLSGQEYS